MFFVVKDAEKTEAIKEILRKADIQISYNNYKEFMIIVDCEFLKKNAEVLLEIHSLRYKVATEDEE